MMQRCYNLNARNYNGYGKRGVTIWEPWHNRTAFIFGLLALLGERPENHTLDRINPHDGYFPWNVRWADKETQNANRRKRIPDYFIQCGEH